MLKSSFSDINFAASCDRTAALLATNAQDGNSQSEGVIFGVWSLLNATTAGGIKTQSIADIANWYAANERNKTSMSSSSVVRTMVSQCKPQVCKLLAAQGSTDYLNTAVLAAFSVQLALTLLFLVSICYYILVKKKTPGRFSTQLLSDTTIFAALQSAIGVFCDTSMLFALAINIATLIPDSTDVAKPNGALRLLSVGMATLLPASLWSIHTRSCSLLPYRRAVFHITACMAVAAFITKVSSNANRAARDYNDWCYDLVSESGDTVVLILLTAFTYPYIFLRFITYVCALFRHSWAKELRKSYGVLRVISSIFLLFFTSSLNPVRLFSKAPNNFWRQTSKWFDGLTALFSFGISCACFYFFIVYQQFSGGQHQSQWNFGQILAIAIWIPTAVEFASIANKQINGYKWRLPVGVQAYIQENEETLGPIHATEKV